MYLLSTNDKSSHKFNVNILSDDSVYTPLFFVSSDFETLGDTVLSVEDSQKSIANIRNGTRFHAPLAGTLQLVHCPL